MCLWATGFLLCLHHHHHILNCFYSLDCFALPFPRRRRRRRINKNNSKPTDEEKMRNQHYNTYSFHQANHYGNGHQQHGQQHPQHHSGASIHNTLNRYLDREKVRRESFLSFYSYLLYISKFTTSRLIELDVLMTSVCYATGFAFLSILRASAATRPYFFIIAFK